MTAARAVGTMLALAQLRKSYDDGRSFAVDGVGFEAAAGELVVLVGESGCGKTTTLKMINRLVEPTSGAIRIDGYDALQADPVQLRRSIGYVIQGVGLFPHMDVAQNVGIIPTLLGWEGRRVRRRVNELLELVDLDPDTYRHRMPAQLSGGQMQRVGFARALAAEPSLVLLDEPFGALDPITRDRLQLEFKQIQRQVGFAAVLVTHDMTEALLMADRIIALREGQVVASGTPHELLVSSEHGYVAGLLGAARRHAQGLAAIAAGEAKAPRP